MDALSFIFEVLLVTPWALGPNNENHLYSEYFNVIQDSKKNLACQSVQSAYTGATGHNQVIFSSQVIFTPSHFDRMNFLSSFQHHRIIL